MNQVEVQQKVTADFIAADPTSAALIPVTRVKTPGGGVQEQDQPARVVQTFKLSLLSYSQTPTITVAGVERIIDYHLIGPHDMEIEVGDYWVDAEGTRFDVVGFSEGFGYETKAFISRHVPREARP